MPSGGNHGGAGRRKLPAELKRKTYQHVLRSVLGDAIAALGKNKSHTVEAIFLKHFGITPLQWEIYICWVECDRQFNLTAEKLGRDPESIRQSVAKVERKLSINQAS